MRTKTPRKERSSPVAHQYRIMEAVADEFGMPVARLRDGGRSRQTDAARKVAYRLLRDRCFFSWGQIAELFGSSHPGNVARQAASADVDMVARCRARLNP
jgi:chromosomal replication initiation ATPase DnaA